MTSDFRPMLRLKGSDSLFAPKPDSDGLFYSAFDSASHLRVGWLYIPDGADYGNVDSWIDALREFKKQTPDLHLLMVKRQLFSEFAQNVENCA